MKTGLTQAPEREHEMNPRTEISRDEEPVVADDTAGVAVEPITSELHSTSVSTRRNERGASLVEYALLIALIALALFTAVGSIGGQVDGRLSTSADMISTANAAG